MWLITGLRVVTLIPNFWFYPNVGFQEIHSLKTLTLLGETFSIPVGGMNPWRVLIVSSAVLFLRYVVDAAVSAWKQGKRRQALVLGSAISTASILGAILSRLMVQGILPIAFIARISLPIVLAMAIELSIDLVRARKLARELRDTQERMRLAVRAANLGLWDWDMVHDEIWTNRELRFEAVQPHDLIAQVTNLLRTEIQTRLVVFHVMVPHDFPAVRADRVHL